jgi:hypothetical protein
MGQTDDGGEMTPEVDTLEVDAFLADSVVVADNKIYAQGAGWDTIFTSSYPARQPRIGIAVTVRIPWSATNKIHKFSIQIVDQDGHQISLGDAPPGANLPDNKVHELAGQFNVGRPPVLAAGDSQVVPIAVNLDGLLFSGPNAYAVLIAVDGEVKRRLPLRIRSVVQMQGLQQSVPPAQSA